MGKDSNPVSLLLQAKDVARMGGGGSGGTRAGEE